MESTETIEGWHNDEIHNYEWIATSKDPNPRQSDTWTMYEMMCVTVWKGKTYKIPNKRSVEHNDRIESQPHTLRLLVKAAI